MPSSTRSEPAVAFAPAEYATRVGAVRAAMAERGFDALVVCGPENICYLLGLDHQGHFAFTAAVLGTEGPARIVIRTMERPTLEAQVPDCVPLTYGDDEDPAPQVAAALAELDAHDAGVELGTMYLPVAVWERIRAATPRLRFTGADGLVERVRQVKSPAEIRCIRAAAAISDRALQAGLTAAGSGVSERRIAAAVYHEMVSAGSSFPGCAPFVRSGETLAQEHVTWGDRELRTGDTLFCELAACVARYHAPCSRMAYVDGAPAGIDEAAAVVGAGLDALRGALRPGALTGDVYAARQAAIDGALGRPARRRHNSGYVVGIGFPPTWSGGGVPVGIRPGGDIEIRAGMTFHVMSWLLGDGPVDYGVSDTALVTDDGCELLTSTARDPIVV
jgi:Xaa-Pro dipeptidase